MERKGEDARLWAAEGSGSANGASVAPVRSKSTYVGAPAVFALTQCCQQINDAFDGFGCYLVGSALQRADWHDVDVRYIMGDVAFKAMFPDAGDNWEFNPRWLLLTVSISGWLSKVTGLPVDFQIQSQTHANSRHKGPRIALGLRIKLEPPTAAHQPTDDLPAPTRGAAQAPVSHV